MPRRLMLGLLGVALGALAAGCTAPIGSPKPVTSSVSTTTPAPETTASLSFGARIDWALMMCTTTSEVSEVAGPLSRLNSLESDFAYSLNRIQTAKQTVDTITATGVPDLDNLTNQLRQSVDGAAPQIVTLLNTAINGQPSGVVDQVTQIVAGIHPNDTDLYDARQATPDVGDALSTASSCPIAPMP